MKRPRPRADLLAAWDINDAGLIVGTGYLDGLLQSFVLDSTTDSIWAVPLLGPATRSEAFQINATGRVVGFAWNGEGRYYGTNPDYVQAFSWDGPGTDPVVLPSVTNNTSHAFKLNDAGMSVGNSYIQTDEFFTLDSVPTLWEFDDQGNVVTTELETAIPNKPKYTLRRGGDVNNEGWSGVSSRKFDKGNYSFPALLLVPDGN